MPTAYDLAAIAAEAVMEFGTTAAVIIPTRAGRTARSLSRFRLPVWIAAVVDDERIARQLHLSYAVHPVVRRSPVGDWSVFAREWIASHGLAGTLAVLLRGPAPARPDDDHTIRLISVGASDQPDARGGPPRSG